MSDAIVVKNVSKRFSWRESKFWRKKKHVQALKNVSFTVKAGEIFALLGPNGAGKSTMMNIIIGLLTPDKGEVFVLEKNMRKDRDVLGDINYTSADSTFHWVLNVNDIMKFAASVYNISSEKRKKRVEKFIKFFGLEKLKNTRYNWLSTGERMRLVFAKAMLNHPKIIIMDEPTIGLDPDMAHKLRDEIKRINKTFGTTILLTSHYMQEVEYLADRVAFINQGRIADIGTVKTLLKKSRKKNLEDYFIHMKERGMRAEDKGWRDVE